MSRMALDKVRSTLDPDAADRIFLVGTEGIGKSTFAADAEAAIFLAAESGLERIDADAFPAPETYQDCCDAVETLTVGKHDYKTFVVDTADWMDDLIRAECMKRKGWSTFNQLFAEGEKDAAEIWRGFVRKLDRLRDEKNMEIIVLAHAESADFTPPNLDHKYQRFQAKLEKRVYPILKEWADVHLFAHWEEWEEGKNKSSKKARTSGNRLLHCTRTMAWDAKNRWDMPETMPLTYEDFEAHRSVAREALRSGKDTLTDKAMELYDELKPDKALDAKIKKGLMQAKGNAAKMRAYVARLQQLINEKQTPEEVSA